jgi:UDP-galactopyranose mutase
MPTGPFASSVVVGRAEPEWAALNKVTGIRGKDALFDHGVKSEAPLDLDPEVMCGDLSSCPEKVDLLIVGAGLSGAVIAERCSKELGMTSMIIDKREHIGGNCYDYIDQQTGVRCSKYGAPLFHTRYQRVWDYIQQFTL